MDSGIAIALIAAVAQIFGAVIGAWGAIKAKEKDVQAKKEAGKSVNENKSSFWLWGIGGAIIGAAVVLLILIVTRYLPIVPNKPLVSAETIFEANFEDEDLENFVLSGNWQVVKDTSTNKVLEVDSQGVHRWYNARFGSRDWDNYIIEFKAKLKFCGEECDLYLTFRENNEGDAYTVIFDDSGTINLTFAPGDTDKSWEDIGLPAEFGFKQNEWHHILVEVNDSNLKLYVDDVLRKQESDTRLTNGFLAFNVAPNTIAQIDDVRVRAID